MATSTQRILMIALTINLLMSFATEFYKDPDTFSLDFMDTHITSLGDVEEEFESDDETYLGRLRAGATEWYENTIGSAVRWGGTLISVFFKSFDPWPMDKSLFSTQVERTLIDLLTWFRFGLIFLILLEAYLVFKNRKQT